jgi:tripeptide aminopeptidase
MNSDRLLQRFLRYVRVDTAADPSSPRYPSSEGQRELGRLLTEELREIGLTDAAQDAHGLVTATIPATLECGITVGLNAHLDTSPESPGAGVQPQVIREYAGGDLVLPGDRSQVIRVADNPELSDRIGDTLITSDGTTLLGADDKAGVAVIVELAAFLREHPEIDHGHVRLLFTCDEEIGHGVDHVDLEKLGADVCYTLDGPAAGFVDTETFSADLATVSIRGRNIHPSIAKGRMVNAARVAADFLSRLPRERLAPEVTADREGFLHPYELQAAVAQAELRVLLRDFATDQLAEQRRLLAEIAEQTAGSWPGSYIEVDVRPQYRNMAEGLEREPRAVALVEEAYRRLGRTVKRTAIRGGTDGSRLTELGLPTPNLSVGQHNPHSPLEWASLAEMAQAGEVVVELLRVWAEPDTPR